MCGGCIPIETNRPLNSFLEHVYTIATVGRSTSINKLNQPTQGSDPWCLLFNNTKWDKQSVRKIGVITGNAIHCRPYVNFWVSPPRVRTQDVWWYQWSSNGIDMVLKLDGKITHATSLKSFASLMSTNCIDTARF